MTAPSNFNIEGLLTGGGYNGSGQFQHRRSRFFSLAAAMTPLSSFNIGGAVSSHRRRLWPLCLISTSESSLVEGAGGLAECSGSRSS
ncbi:OLC1v1011562C2 [Oldenlandia corymbosa var. corymbosa]|nr:OLC1v1011562C2 [Oldenlandia corymbosa var. corymbosa]